MLLGDGGAVAAEVEGVDEHVWVRSAAGHLAQVDPVDQLGQLGHLRGPEVAALEVELALRGEAGEAARTTHAHRARAGLGRRWRLARTVRVRRTGGFAGLVADGEVDLDAHDDERAPELAALVGRIDLREVAGGTPKPDMYVFAFDLCGDRATVPEQHLTDDLRRVAELVLDRRTPG